MISKRSAVLNSLSHEYLWSPTPIYYVGSYILFAMLKSKMKLTMQHSLPFLAIPPTLDFVKRDYYTGKFGDDKRALYKSRGVVD